MNQLAPPNPASRDVSAAVSPEKALGHVIENLDRRRAEILLLAQEFKETYAIVSDLTKVNDILQKSDRHDLVMIRPVPQMQIDKVEDLSNLNNFISNVKNLWFAVPKEIDSEDRKNSPYAGKRPLTYEELQLFIAIGGRDYDDFMTLSEQVGMQKQIAIDFAMYTHVLEPAFIRMLIVIPDFTQQLQNKVFDADCLKIPCDEEIFVAYALMSKLVDEKDPHIIREDGTTDIWKLCR